MKKLLLVSLSGILFLSSTLLANNEEPVSDFEKKLKVYKKLKHHKAMAIGMDNEGGFVFWYTHNHPHPKRAQYIALKKCNEAVFANNMNTKCEIYARGNKILFDLADR